MSGNSDYNMQSWSQSAGNSIMGYGYPAGYGLAPSLALNWASQAYAMQSYSYGVAASYAMGNAYTSAMGAYAAVAAATSGTSTTAASGGRHVGKKGDYGSMLEEMKATHATRTKLRDEQRKLQEKIEACSDADLGQRTVFRQRLHAVEQQLRLMGEVVGGPSRSGTAATAGHSGVSEEQQRRYRSPEDGTMDQFGRLCHALACTLKNSEECACTIKQAEEERRVQQEWTDLAHSGLVSGTSRLEHFLRERPLMFTIFEDLDGQLSVRLAGDRDREPAGASASGRPAKVARADFRSCLGYVLTPDRVREIEAYMKKAGGSERVSRLGAIFGVDEAQLARHFSLYEDHGRMYATPILAGSSAASSSRDGLEALDRLLGGLRPTRSSIGEAMAFCLEANSQNAALYARGLIRALEEPDLETNSVLARVFLISDVLYNCSSGARGAGKYRASFQELLPDACARLGRKWLRSIKQVLEQSRVQLALRRVLAVWVDWGVFPPLYSRGLEALLFAPVPEVPEPPDAEADEALRRKLSRWCTAADAARLPYAARMRGLSGSALPTLACRARLCHFERYWHRREEGPSSAAEEDGWGEELRRVASGDSTVSHEDGLLDGDPLSDGDPGSEDDWAEEPHHGALPLLGGGLPLDRRLRAEPSIGASSGCMEENLMEGKIGGVQFL